MDKLKRAEEIAVQILKYSRNELLVSLRFMDLALCKLEYKMENLNSIATDGKYMYFNPKHIFRLYETGSTELNHSYMHTVFHCIFYHPFVNKTIDNPVLWDLACDIAVEGIISELEMKQLETANTVFMNRELAELKGKYGKLTAEKLYRRFIASRISEREILRLQTLFAKDEHFPWYSDESDSDQSNHKSGQETQKGTQRKDKADKKESDKDDKEKQNIKNTSNSDNDEDEQSNPNDAGDGEESNNGDEDSQNIGNSSDSNNEQTEQADSNDAVNQQITAEADFSESVADSAKTKEEWQEISERMKVDVETISNGRGGQSQGLIQNLAEVNREKYDYTEFLKKFAILGEEMQVNDDEFDYVFYTYGLQLFKNVPLVEPLEYKDVKRIKEFVLAIDTSGSVQGDLVQKFVQKTYNVLKSTESFFSKINLHIIQCDDQIQEDVKITSQEEFDAYFSKMQLKGFGGNNEVLLFSYVDDLIKKGEFQNLKGMIYFTDGYGIFPQKKPEYEVAFVFVENERWPIPTVPPWVIKLVLEKEDL